MSGRGQSISCFMFGCPGASLWLRCIEKPGSELDKKVYIGLAAVQLIAASPTNPPSTSPRSSAPCHRLSAASAEPGSPVPAARRYARCCTLFDQYWRQPWGSQYFARVSNAKGFARHWDEQRCSPTQDNGDVGCNIS
jgi:hypothetical protein